MLEKLSKEELMNLNNARILYYDFFNGFFVFELLDDRVEIFQKQLAILKNAPLSEEVEADFLLLENEISCNGIVNIKDEFSRLFALPFGDKQVGSQLSHFYENCEGGNSLLQVIALIKIRDIGIISMAVMEKDENFGFWLGLMQ